MKKVALVFVLAVLVPSLLLAWLAVRSLRDQQFLLERQQSLLDQHVTDTLAQNIADYLAQRQQEFSAQVESMAAGADPQVLAAQFDDQLRQHWPLADVGFCVTAGGKILSPPPNGRPAAQMFRLDNSGFLGNREPVEVYLTANNGNANNGGAGGYNAWNNNSTINYTHSPAGQVASSSVNSYADNSVNAAAPAPQEQTRQEPAPSQQREGVQSVVPQQTVALGGASPDSSFGNGTADSINPGSTAVAPPGSQAYTLNNNRAANISSHGPANHLLDGRNSFYIPPSGQASTSSSPVAIAPVAINQQLPVIPQTPDAAANTPGKDTAQQPPVQNFLNYKAAETRKVSPQSKKYEAAGKTVADNNADDSQENLSKVVAAEAEFRQLIGDQTDGMLARFLQNKLKLMCWHRLSSQPDLIFGAQLNLDRVVDGLRALAQPNSSWGGEICLAVLDDNARPVVLSRQDFQANWKRPFVATEVGDALPHWEVTAYLLNPAQLTQNAQTTRLTLGLLIAVLVVAIGIGSLLIVRALQTELKLARQKTDFVSNVSHELKTPLTSIRMFSELLAEGRVVDQAKQHSYLQIITAEAARLTRLINNVLDFSRMERGEKKYNILPCDLTDIVRSTTETFRPHLETGGFKFVCDLPDAPISIRGDSDALSQVIVNLLSNAEKYSIPSERRAPPRPVGVQASACPEDRLKSELQPDASEKEITLQLVQKQSPLRHAEIKVLDRGPGVPRGSEEKIFEKFYRAHDSLSSGVQGCGLGLTIARQIARAHGGDVAYEPRDGGGSCFTVRLPISTTDEHR